MLSEATFNGIYNIVSEIFESPERELVIWIEQNTKHFIEFDHWYKNSDNKNISLDTGDREHVYDVIGMYFLKTPWPIFGEGPEKYRSFVKDLQTEAEKYNWKLKG